MTASKYTTSPALHPAARARSPLRSKAEATVARVALAGASRLSINSASNLGGRLLRTLGPLSAAHRTAVANMARAMPDLSPAARDAFVREAWDNLGRTIAEFAILPRMWPDRWRDRVTVTESKELAAIAALHQPVIFFSGHLANWEVMAIVLAARVRPMTIAYRPPNNHLIDAMIRRIRKPYASALAPKGSNGARLMMKALYHGEPVCLLVDQKINTGIEIPFFGRGAFTGPVVAKFAMRFRCPVFPVRCERIDGARFHVTIEDPWLFEGDENDENAVGAALTRVNARLEDWIRARPGQWLWMHQRWPREG